MGSIIYSKAETSEDEATAITIDIDEAASEHQVGIEFQSATTISTGTIALAVLARDDTEYTTLVGSDGNALALSATAGPHTIRFDGRFISLKATPSTYDGDTFSVNAKGW